MVKDLDDLLSLDHLLHIAVHAAQSRLLPLEAHPTASADGLHRQQHQRQECEGNKRQHPVQVQHHPYGAQKGQRAGNKVGKAGVYHLRNSVDVVGKPAHKVAGLVGVEISQGKGLQMVEQVPPYSRHGVLGDMHHDPRVSVGAGRRQSKGSPQHAQHPNKSREISRQDIVVDNGLEQVAGEDGRTAAHHQAHRHQHHGAPVVPHVGEELFYRPLHVLGLLVAVLLPAAVSMPADLFHFSHPQDLLPAGTDTLPGRSRWFSAIPRGFPCRRSFRRPAPRSCPRPPRRRSAGQ